jgi:alkenylglycerophosphocholine/alkenylglycerophosphoethanolamine hydrolase
LRRDRAFLLAGLLAAAVYFAALLAGSPVLCLLTKPVPALLLAAWMLPEASRVARLVTIGLLLSALGDLLLEISPDLFIAGLGAFLVAHLAYVGAFLEQTRQPAMRFALPVACFGAVSFLWLLPKLGAMTWPVLAYVVVICTMMWRAWAQVADTRLARRGAWCAALGATSFGISDTLVAWNRFVAPVLALKLLLMLLYWAGQWGIAASARAPRSTTATNRR